MHRKGVSASLVLILLAAVGGGYYMMQQENGGDFSLPGDLGGIISGGGACGAGVEYLTSANNSNFGTAESLALFPDDFERSAFDSFTVSEITCTKVESTDQQINDTLEWVKDRENQTNSVNYTINDVTRLDISLSGCSGEICGGFSSDMIAARTNKGWKVTGR